eukprot:3842343-Rhodomonas_salina.1
MKCKKWKDTEDDESLEYRFGVIEKATGTDLGWTAWEKSKKYQDGKYLAAGAWTFKAQVRDSKGAVTAIMYDDVVVDLAYDTKRDRKGGSGRDRRRLLEFSLSTAWETLIASTDGLADKLLLESKVGVMDEVKALTVAIANNNPALTTDERVEVTRRLYDALDVTATKASLDGYTASFLEATQSITTAKADIQYVSPQSAVLASNIVKTLAGSSLLTTLPAAPAQDAYDVMAVAVSALQYNISCIGNDTGTVGESAFAKTVMSNYETGLDDVATKYGASLVSGEGVQEFNSFASKHQVYLEPLNTKLNGIPITINVADIITTSAAQIVDFVLPSNLATVLGIAATTDVTFDVGIYEYGPVIDNMVPVSPVVSVSLFDGLTALDTSSLTTPVVLTIPLDTTM